MGERRQQKCKYATREVTEHSPNSTASAPISLCGEHSGEHRKLGRSVLGTGGRRQRERAHRTRDVAKHLKEDGMSDSARRGPPERSC